MLKSMLAVGKMHFKSYNIYASNFYLFTLNRVVEVIIYIFVWQAIYQQTGETTGFSLAQMITYYILVVALVPFALWGINEDIAHSIRNGQINRQLLNPISYFHYYFGMNLGELGFGLLVAGATFLICTIFWPVVLPASFLHFVLFVFIILLGIPITFCLQMIVGTAGFYTNSIWGMQILRKSIISIFSGLIAPLTLFPNWFQTIANWLPFQELIYTPINLYLGKIPLNEVGFVFLKLIFWTIILYGIAKIFFEHAIKNITINGG